MARLQMIQIDGADDLLSEDAALSASPIACAVADAWARPEHTAACAIWAHDAGFGCWLDKLELATRNSPLRKVKP